MVFVHNPVENHFVILMKLIEKVKKNSYTNDGDIKIYIVEYLVFTHST